MAQKPGNRNGSIRHALVCRDRIDFLVEFGELRVIQEDTFKEAILEWGPGLNSNIIQTAIIQNTAISVDGAVNLHVHIDSRVDHASIGDTKLELIEEDFLLHEFA